MLSVNTIIGEPQLFKQNIYIYPPKVKDIVKADYDIWKKLLTLSQEDLWDAQAEREGKMYDGKINEKVPTPFEYLLINCYNSEEFMSKAQDAFFFFTHERVKILPKGRMVLFSNGIDKAQDVSDLRILKEEDYFDFQNKIREACGEDILEPPNPDENPHVALIKAKGRLRERLKKKKGNKDNVSFSTMLISLCCMKIGITPLNIGEITFPVVSSLFNMMQKQEKYNTDIKIMTAGFGNSKVKPEYWVKDENLK